MRFIRILKGAARDLERGQAFYDGLAEGLGDRFLDSIFRDLERLRLVHGVHSRDFGLHRMLAERFPFGIYYLDEEHETVVFAVLDLRRDPNWIQEQLGERNS